MARPHLGGHSTSYDRLNSTDGFQDSHFTAAMQDNTGFPPGYRPAPDSHASRAGSYQSQYSYHGNDAGIQRLSTSPSPYSQQQQQQHPPYPQDSDDMPELLHLQQQQQQQSYYTPSFTHPGKILALQAIATLSTILFTAIPVVIKGGDSKSWGNWYSWKDLVRLLEPFVSGLIHCWFFYSADLMQGSTWNTTAVNPAASSVVSNPSLLRRSSTPLGLNSYLPTDEIAMAGNHHNAQKPSGQYSYHSPHHSNINSAQEDHVIAGHHLRPPPRSFRHTPKFRSALAVVFTIFLMIYVTGAALHTAAAFFKSTIEFFLDNRSQGIGLSTHPLTTGDGSLSFPLAQELKQGYVLIQDTWEHLISHYIYAVGALGMSWCEMVAYADQTLPRGINLARVGSSWRSGPHHSLGILAGRRKTSKRLVPLFFLTGILYGAIIAGVSCQYPKGIYVGYAYTGAMMLILVVYILAKERGRLDGLFSLGRYYILQTYLIGGVVALVAITIYLAVHKFDFLTSNDKSHNGTHSRP